MEGGGGGSRSKGNEGGEGGSEGQVRAMGREGGRGIVRRFGTAFSVWRIMKTVFTEICSLWVLLLIQPADVKVSG